MGAILTESTKQRMKNLEMLSAREQLMEDIDCIIEGFFYDTWGSPWGGELTEDKNELVRVLCDAVCANFPSQS